HRRTFSRYLRRSSRLKTTTGTSLPIPECCTPFPAAPAHAPAFGTNQCHPSLERCSSRVVFATSRTGRPPVVAARPTGLPLGARASDEAAGGGPTGEFVTVGELELAQHRRD